MSSNVLAFTSKRKSWINLECVSSALSVLNSPVPSADVGVCVGWRMVSPRLLLLKISSLGTGTTC